MELVTSLERNKKRLKEMLPIDSSFDIVGRDLYISNTEAYLLFIDGFAKDDIMLWVINELQSLNENYHSPGNLKKWISEHIGYLEVELTKDMQKIVNSVLSGAVGLFINEHNEGIIIDARTYPARGPEEPDLEKVTRGSRDGFVETIVFNTALIRRRIRDHGLIFEMKSVGKRSKTDVVIAYIDDLVDQELLKELKEKIDNIQVDSLVMAEKTLEELIIKKKWYNPLPQTRFTERPDVVAAHLFEGHCAVLVDTSPSVMLFPATIFHFTQHSEDYYQNPLVGTYIRWVRFLSIMFSFCLSSIWLLLVNHQASLPEALSFIGAKEEVLIPLFIQFLILELGLDVLRIASIHTPNTLSTSLGVIGGLILGQLAVEVGWVVPETVLYMAAVGIGTFATPSIEFAMAIRIFRLVLLILTGLFDIYGFVIGLIIITVIIFTTNTLGKIKYTWPLIPFNGKALTNLLFRKPIINIKRNERKK